MEQDSAIRSTDAKVLALMVVVFAALLGLIGFVVSPSADDASTLMPPTAHAAVGSTAQQGKVATKGTTTPEENWAPDESAHGMRPDAAH